MSMSERYWGTAARSLLRWPRPNWPRIAPPLVTGIAILLLWEALPRVFGVSTLLIPPASAVFVALLQGIFSGVFLEALAVTMTEALLGFVLGSVSAIVIAALITRSEFLERALMPYLVALQSLPKVALAPLLVVWFGFSIGSKIAIATIISFFPVLINSIVGFSTVEAEKLELMRSLVASRWQTFRIVLFPNALPFIFAGLNVAIVFSVTGALVGEFVGATVGLGTLLMQMNFNLDIAGMFAVLVVLALMGVILHGIIRFLHRRLVYWAEPENVERNGS
ncbi:ABC transporter permease [Azospirillum sp.]|uniref:ABC transporter permease n=1 Tax=Azospirillum sp. TaxID=34012 RepID=UPI003D7315A9